MNLHGGLLTTFAELFILIAIKHYTSIKSGSLLTALVAPELRGCSSIRFYLLRQVPGFSSAEAAAILKGMKNTRVRGR
jgi:hypothetical protein